MSVSVWLHLGMSYLISDRLLPLATLVSTEPFSHRHYQHECGACRRKLQLTDLICVFAVRLRQCPTLSNPVL